MAHVELPGYNAAGFQTLTSNATRNRTLDLTDVTELGFLFEE